MSIEDIGPRIRRLRRRLRWTLTNLADRCGFSPSLLSRIETGKTMPPVATLTKVAAALGVSTSAFLGDGPGRRTVAMTAAETDGRMRVTDKGYCFATLAAERLDKLMQPLIFEAERGRIRPEPLTHSGEEFIHVLKGSMRYRVGSTEYLLRAGDSLYFDAEQPHELAPVTPKVRFLAVFVEPPGPRHPTRKEGRRSAHIRIGRGKSAGRRRR